LNQNSNADDATLSMAESTAVAQKQVVRGLGYPNGREEISPEAVGWQPITEEITTIEKQVSRETSR
jgi:hypothetical protein